MINVENSLKQNKVISYHVQLLEDISANDFEKRMIFYRLTQQAAEIDKMF